MPSFQPMFTETMGKPIVYQGRTLVMSDAFPCKATSTLRLIFESTNSEWRQGISLKCTGKFLLLGKHFDGKNGLILWQDTAPATVELEVTPEVESIRVYNSWDWGDGVTHAKHHGAAMIVEEIPNGRRYLCNDGHPDDDFDDLIFRLERVPAEE